MKGKTRRCLSAVLILCLVLTMLPTVTIEAEAASVTLSASDVANYVNSLVGTSYPSGYCLAFVADCFENLGATRSSACCAYNYGNSHIQSTDASNIPIGADVFFGNCGGTPSSSHGCNSPTFGHIGIYVGDGYFIHATGGTVQKGTLSSSYWSSRFRGWGYHGNVTISGGTVSNNHTVDGGYTPYLPIHAYTISTGNITVYNAAGAVYNNRYITGSTDLCIIQEIYTDGWCKVKYPSSAESSGYFTAYVLLSEFIPSVSVSSWTATANATAYRRSSGTETIGSVSAGDSGLKVSSANGRIQIIYPVTGKDYYKMGWIEEGSPAPNPGPTPVAEYLLPCYSYPISTGSISVYDASHNKHSNRYITGSTDNCIIREIYTDGWCYVSYPSSAESDGWFEAYVPLSEFIANPNIVYWTATGDYTAYRRSTGSETIGSITSGDSCVVVSEANGRMQVMYPVTGQNYYKMGWIATSLANNPQGMLDSVTGGMYTVCVRGWAFDKDDMNAQLKIHVYIGGVGYEITANTERPDVNSAYGCGNYHGYDATISVDNSLTGNQTVEVYAINVGSGTNVLLGSGTVNVGSDTTAPVISNVSVSDISSSGYTVTCSVTDENGIDRVQFPTWTSHNGQDDLFADWTVNNAASGTRNGNTYTYRVHTTAHNYEGGEYTTHIYAFDKYGNQTQYNVPVVRVPIDVISVDFDSLELNFDKVGDTKTLTAYVYPENATDQALTWESSDTSVATVSNGAVTAVGAGTAVITATAGNGVYGMCTVTVAEAILKSIQIATNPIKTIYYVGDTLDTTGLTLKATYSDGATKTISEGFSCTPTTLNIVGTQTITVSYEGKSTTFTVTIKEKQVGSISVSAESGSPGETVTVRINMDTNPGIVAARLKIGYDSDVLTLTDVKDGGILGEYVFGGDLASNPYIVMWENGLATEDFSNTGTLVYLTFEIAEDAPVGEQPITVSYDPQEIYNKEESNVAFTCTQGAVTVEEGEKVDPDAPQVVVGTTSARAGDTVTLDVVLKNNPGISSVVLKIDYDTTRLKIESAQFGDVLSEGAFVNYNLPYITLVRSGDCTEDVSLVTITFSVLAEAEAGEAYVTLEYSEGDITNYDEENVEFAVVPGNVIIKDHVPGDINGDGKVNSKDLTRLLKYISHEEVTVNEVALDVNGDGKVNSKDLTRLLKYISHEDVEIH